MTHGADFDIIFLALARWDAPYSSTALSLAKALSKETRVFYIDNPVTVAEFIRKRNSPAMKLRKKRLQTGDTCFTPDASHPNFFVVTPAFALPINWLPAGFLYDSFSRLNDQRISATINSVLRTQHVKRFILVNSFNPLFGNALSLDIEPILRVYQSVDDIQQAPYLDKHGSYLEKLQVAATDFTLVTSSHLLQKLATHGRHVYHLPNAANTSLFSQAITKSFSRPVLLNAVPAMAKVVTYIGNICQRLDYELIQKVAKTHPEKFIVLVGPHALRHKSSVTYFEKTGIAKLSNVILTGPQSQKDLPALLQHSHCCIIPFLCNDLTKSIYPLKINEYLAAGKPVVSTAFSADILGFRQVATIAENHQQFVNAIDKAIADDSKTRQTERLLFAAGNTWEARARTFIELAVEFLKHHDRRTGFQRRRGKQILNRNHAE